MKSILRCCAPLLLILVAAGIARAQFHIKPGVGVTFNEFSQDPSTGKYSGKVGYQLGGSIVSREGPYFEVGLFYTRKSVEFQEASTNVTVSNDLDGMRIPIMLGFPLFGSDEEGFGLRAFGGGSIMLITSVNIPNASIDDFTSPTYGLFAGAGVDISIIFVDLAYEWSLSEVSEISTVDVGQTRTFLATAGVKFSL